MKAERVGSGIIWAIILLRMLRLYENLSKMSMRFNMFPDSSSDFEDGKSQLRELEGRKMKTNFVLKPKPATVGQTGRGRL